MIGTDGDGIIVRVGVGMRSDGLVKRGALRDGCRVSISPVDRQIGRTGGGSRCLPDLVCSVCLRGFDGINKWNNF